MSEVFIVIREPNNYDNSVDVHSVFDSLVNAQRTAADLNEKIGWKEERDGEPYIVIRQIVQGNYYSSLSKAAAAPVFVPGFNELGEGEFSRQ